jgi:hypothetical protein
MWAALLASILTLSQYTMEQPAPGDMYVSYNGIRGLIQAEIEDNYISLYIDDLQRYENYNLRSSEWLREKRIELNWYAARTNSIGFWYDKNFWRYGEPRRSYSVGETKDIINWGPVRFSSKLKLSLKDYSWDIRTASNHQVTFKIRPSLTVSTSSQYLVSSARLAFQWHLIYKQWKYSILTAYVGWKPDDGPLIFFSVECDAW